MSTISPLQTLLNHFRQIAQTEREKGSYFEALCIQYFKNEPYYADLYSDVWLYADWAANQEGFNKKDTGIDLVAKTHIEGEYHAIQCKLYSPDYKLMKADIDSFFTASGKSIFTRRIIISTTDLWSDNALDALVDQNPPVTKIDLSDLEASQIDWMQYHAQQSVVLKPKKTLRDHQKSALLGVEAGLSKADRGKLIMACGTGKTFTSLKIAEKLAGKGKRVLFLVPSLSLLSQTLTEWTQESSVPLHSFAVCSDSDVGKKRQKNKQDEDRVEIMTHELRYPATTNADRLALEVANRSDDAHMSVIFSTYQSIDVISRAQKECGMKDFDLIICDEAHRTTGATFITDDDESNFVKVHDQNFIRSDKRLYMTATPRIYGDDAKMTAIKDSAVLCSMDDEAIYGKELYVINFSEAVQRGLLVDYKVIVLAVDEAHVEKRLQELMKDDDHQIRLDDAAKIIGCWKALAKQGLQESLLGDAEPMQRAVAFCQVIEPNHAKNVANPEKVRKSTTHKVSSKHIASMFSDVVEAYKASEVEADPDFVNDPAYRLHCELAHVDGSMNAGQKEAKLMWLKAETQDDDAIENNGKTCRILSNVRCLSEGVDVPALDAVLFLTPRNSQVDVVQSVGRVMRNSPGKKRGYVILPVAIPAGVDPKTALDDNKTYKVVWDVLQALRSHDDHFDAMINKMEFNGSDKRKMEVIAISDKITPRISSAQKEAFQKSKKRNAGRGSFSIGEQETSFSADTSAASQMILQFDIGVIEKAIYAKIVKKCGNRHHWEDWANDIASIANKHIFRITSILNNPKNTDEIAVFNEFAHELRDDLNANLSDTEIIEMLAQHLITKPVFEALFEDYSFAEHNPMSKAMQLVLDILENHHIDQEADTLQRFYDSVKIRAKDIDTAQGKQKIVIELYDKFFRNAFPKMTERLGIVYTPVEVVDFIIHSVNDVLKSEFKQDLGSENVHIIDPFTGTGTFITRLLQSGLIAPDKLAYKYKNEIHANEIVLLAYYIAAINIESVYHEMMRNTHSDLLPKGEGDLGEYVPFNGICLTDTFAMYEQEDLVDEILIDNSKRRKRQKSLDIRVIIGNPPYSAGQESANDNNANVAYPSLDERIRSTYAANSKATNKNALYDSYIRAIRWASDRIKDAGVIGFVSGSGFIEKPAMAGVRKCLIEEFSNIHVLNLRGDIRKNMLSKGKAKEGQNVFKSGSMTGIAITILVKNPHAKSHGNVFYHNIGDDLTADSKLEILANSQSIKGIEQHEWLVVNPDKHGDWINQRDDSFSEFISLGDKKDKSSINIFESYSMGIKSNRDSWVYNFSKSKLIENISNTINFYNSEVQRYIDEKSELEASVFVEFDSTKFSWGRANKWDLEKRKKYQFQPISLYQSMYRPFTKNNFYFHKDMNDMIYLMPKIFPDATTKNFVICISGVGAQNEFTALLTNKVPNLHTIQTGQCFPLKLYEPTNEVIEDDLFSSKGAAKTNQSNYTVKDGISDAGLAHFQKAYPNEKISKEDLFYYIYGLLHSEEYKSKFSDNLSKELPRIPAVKQAKDFWSFSQAGRQLADLHVNYEQVALYPVGFDYGDKKLHELKDADFYVTKMKFAKGKNGEKSDKTCIHYNQRITVNNIPLEAYEYIVNGKSAIEWVMERQSVTTHKDSGIVNDANDWAIETMQNAKYPLELLCRVITVSIETLKIIKSLPKLEI